MVWYSFNLFIYLFFIVIRTPARTCPGGCSLSTRHKIKGGEKNSSAVLNIAAWQPDISESKSPAEGLEGFWIDQRHAWAFLLTSSAPVTWVRMEPFTYRNTGAFLALVLYLTVRHAGAEKLFHSRDHSDIQDLPSRQAQLIQSPEAAQVSLCHFNFILECKDCTTF